MRVFFFILLLLPFSSRAAYDVPTGPRANYDASTNMYIKATGGPLWNYDDNGTWRAINTDFRLEGGRLVSDSNTHKVYGDLSTNTFWLEQSNHWLGERVGPLYAIDWVTKDTTRLASPDYSDRSFIANTVTYINIYPGVDVVITNSSSGFSHQFDFSPTAMAAIETWWDTHGASDDIYIVSTVRWFIDSLNCALIDDAGSIDLETPSDITGAVRFLTGGTPLLACRAMNVSNGGYINSYDDYRVAPLFNRFIAIAGGIFHAEGFNYAAVRGWSGGGVAHSELFGNDNSSGTTDMGLVVDDKVSFNHTMNAETGTAVSLHCRLHDSFNGDGVATGFIYSHNAGTDDPEDLLAVSTTTATVNVSSHVEYSVDISYALEASTEYWIGVQNSGPTTIRVQDNNANDLDSKQNTDALPLEDPHTAGLEQSVNAYIWVVYTTGVAEVGQVMFLKVGE